ncbi:Negative regulator of genetic competence ClpC/MecB [Rubripirellula amarantea]|uniref:Negative regulator of genetic competence ClpC/MecB n=1 Tax=Rubripirellula amarantea TaxID=2527999 RepID=A0A5C5WLK0_9BACT|nr:Clp protease N-terminal domain-containing protein [Rubripirellula amarantea]TWT50652.1 Negative regulator of genetic competence ClpC/MecB [Rubripirellula amarantea]
MTIDDQRIDAILVISRPERATDRSRTSIRLAVESADEFADSCVDSCHILCGLLREGQGVASHILRRQFDMTLESLDAAMVARSRIDNPDELVIAPDVKIVMDSTLDFATRLNHSYFGTEHLLAGVIASSTQSAMLLETLGLTHDAIEHEIIGLLGHLT